MTSVISVRSSSLRSRARRRLGRPQPRQVARDARERLALGGGQRFGAAALELGELATFTLELAERRLQARLERARDEPVLGLAGVELAARAVGLELGALDGEPLTGEALVVLALDLARSLAPTRGSRPA